MSWIQQSIMHTRGVAHGAVGQTHELTEQRQGEFQFTMGPYSKPVLHIQPGDRVQVETVDAFGGVIKTTSDSPTKLLKLPFLNPQCGPILVDGAEKGDVLAVHIESIVPRGEQPRGTICLIPHFGGLTNTDLTATLNPPLPEIVRKVAVDEHGIHWNEHLTLPYKPHIGTLSCSPEIEAINSLTPDRHGGNMDVPDVAPGNILYLPVRAPGGRIFIGDAHACQGDGELSGTGVEIASYTTIHVDLIKGWNIEWPRLESEGAIMVIGSARPLEDATRIAYCELVLWMEKEFGFDRYEAYMLLSQCGMVRLGNVVDPKYSIAAGIRKEHLKGA
ncbi:MAG TPA: acetamidase/formamidase family protein [Chthoniobacterales bacterium]